MTVWSDIAVVHVERFLVRGDSGVSSFDDHAQVEWTPHRQETGWGARVIGFSLEILSPSERLARRLLRGGGESPLLVAMEIDRWLDDDPEQYAAFYVATGSWTPMPFGGVRADTVTDERLEAMGFGPWGGWSTGRASFVPLSKR